MPARFLAIASVAATALVPSPCSAQTSSLVPRSWFEAIRGESSGELPFADFRTIVTRFSGFSPAIGGDQIADYIAGRMHEYELDEVKVEGFPADGKRFFWAYLTEPAWDGETGVLAMVEPHGERLADFAANRAVVADTAPTRV
jgi:hypothetical protein